MGLVGPCRRPADRADLAAFKGLLGLVGLVWMAPAIVAGWAAWPRLRWATALWGAVAAAQLAVVLTIVVNAEPAPLCL